MKKIIALMMIVMIATSTVAFASTPAKKPAAEKKLKILIDAGHQKKGNSQQEPVAPGSKTKKAKVSSGTTGVSTKKPEYVLNLEVSLKLRDKLVKEGYEVIMVRETHDVDISNAERATMAAEKGCDLVIRIHADGSENKNVSGYSILIPGSDYIKDKQLIANSKLLGEYVNEGMKANVNGKSRGLFVRNDLTGFNWLTVPGVLIEMGYMSNPQEDEKMSEPKYQDSIVDGIAAGVETYYKNMKK